MVIALLVAYVVSMFTSRIPVKTDASVSFAIRKKDWQRKEVYILLAFFVVILIVGALAPQIYG